MTTPVLGLVELAEAQDSPEIAINENMRTLEVLVQAVVTGFVSSLPGSPVQGARYILTAPSGGGLEGDIAYYSNGWKFATPSFGWSVWSVDDNAMFRFETGSPIAWVNVGQGGGGGGGGATDAASVSYSGTLTGSTATNVQDAIDNIAEIVGGSPTFIGGGGGGGSSGDLAAAILTDTPTGYWKCNESAGTTFADSSGGGKNLTVQGTYALARSPLLPSDPTQKFVKFTSTTNAGAFNSTGLGTLPVSGDLTIECVMNYVGSNAGQARVFQIFSPHASSGNDNGQVLLYVQSDGTFHYFTQHSNRSSDDVGLSVPVLKNKTHHYALVKDATAKTHTLYIDGVEQLITSYTNETDGGSAATTFGIGTGAGVEAGNATSDTFTIGHVAFYRGVKLTVDRIFAHAVAAGLA